MKIQLELEALLGALDTISKIAPPASGNITLQTASSRFTIISTGDISSCTLIVAADAVSGDGEISVSMQAVKDAIKGRQKLELSYNNATLSVKSGKYLAELATVDVIPVDEPDKEEVKEWRITTDQASWLKKALRDVNLKPTTLLSSWMPAGVKITSKGAFVACYDTLHMSWTTAKAVTGDFECVLPVETLLNIVDVFHKTNFVIRQGKNRLYVKNKLTNVHLSMPATDELPSISEVQEKIREASATDGTEFTFGKASFLTFLDNARSVLGKERAEILVTAVKAGVALLIKTGSGQVENVIEGSGRGKFAVDYENMMELVSKASENVQLKVVGDAFLASKLPNSSLIVALNQLSE